MRVQLTLVEVLGHEFNVTLHDSQTLISDVCNMRGCLYAFETSRDVDTTIADDSDRLINIVTLSCDARKLRRYFC